MGGAEGAPEGDPQAAWLGTVSQAEQVVAVVAIVFAGLSLTFEVES